MTSEGARERCSRRSAPSGSASPPHASGAARYAPPGAERSELPSRSARHLRGSTSHGDHLTRFLLICLGGAAGTGARYLVATGMLRWFGPAFPVGTLTVNVAGSFLLASIMELGLGYGAIPPDLRVILATGVMGGFTTYSSFNHEVLGFFQRGAWLLGATYLLTTVVGCLAAGVLGTASARWLAGS